MKIESKIVNGKEVYFVSTPGGCLLFGTKAEAQEFVDWMDWLQRRCAARAEETQTWAGREARSSSNPLIHDLATELAYLSFALTAVNAVESVHLVMTRNVLERLEQIQAEHLRQQEQHAKKKKISTGPKM